MNSLKAIRSDRPWFIFSSNKSFLLRKRMMLVSIKYLLLQTCLKSCSDSWRRFYYICIDYRYIKRARKLTVVPSSMSTWSNSLIAVTKMSARTSSKQWIHFFLCERWPPTSNTLKEWNYICRLILSQFRVLYKIMFYCQSSLNFYCFWD